MNTDIIPEVNSAIVKSTMLNVSSVYIDIQYIKALAVGAFLTHFVNDNYTFLQCTDVVKKSFSSRIYNDPFYIFEGYDFSYDDMMNEIKANSNQVWTLSPTSSSINTITSSVSDIIAGNRITGTTDTISCTINVYPLIIDHIQVDIERLYSIWLRVPVSIVSVPIKDVEIHDCYFLHDVHTFTESFYDSIGEGAFMDKYIYAHRVAYTNTDATGDIEKVFDQSEILMNAITNFKFDRRIGIMT